MSSQATAARRWPRYPPYLARLAGHCKRWLAWLAPWPRFRLRLAPFIEAIPNAVVVVDREGRIAAVNARTETWFGYAHDALLGLPIETLLPPSLRQRHIQLQQSFMHALSARPMGQGRELFACRRDGSTFPVEIGLNPLHTSRGTMVLSSIIDISERKANEARFHAQAEEVAQASRYKSAFLATMSHELRTPLNSILILSEQLCANVPQNLQPKQLNYAEIIHQSGQDLLTLIEDILDLSRIEAGKLDLQPESLDLHVWCDDFLHTFSPTAEARQLTLQCTLHCAPAHSQAILDVRRLSQIVKNLFSNACKFTQPGGQIEITLHSHADTLQLAVRDSGCGIPADKLETIFEAFTQLDNTASRRYSGSGLGLAIVRQLTALLGGTLAVESILGSGSTFTLTLPRLAPLPALPLQTLPLQSVPPVTADTPAAPLTVAHLAGRVVLLVDDEIRNVFAMTSLLEEAGMQVCVARSGQEALDVVQREPGIELVLMDIMMPLMDGYQTIRKLRTERHFTRPILALTALAMSGDREKCLAAGADAYLARPVQRQLLLEQISALLA